MQRPSDSSMGSIRSEALSLLARVLDGFRYHPYQRLLDPYAEPPIHPFTHQMELLYLLSFRRPVRILIGDEIGLGKTIEAISIAKMLTERDGARKILILVPKILINQWKGELGRLRIRPIILRRRDLRNYDVGSLGKGWYIASIDLVKRKEYIDRIVSNDWDVLIVDEAHRVGRVGRGGRYNLRYRLVEKLASKVERSVILLSATPHRGDTDDYLSRLALVDPYLKRGRRELDTDNFYRYTRNAIVVRRTKVDVNEAYEKKPVFREARFVAIVMGATDAERMFNKELIGFARDKLVTYYQQAEITPRALPLLLALITKRASSSPYAAVKTLERILIKRSKELSEHLMMELDEEAVDLAEAYLGLGYEDYGEALDEEAVDPDEKINEFVDRCSILLEEGDEDRLRKLLDLARDIMERGDTRLRGVLEKVREHLGMGDKVVVFTEYRDTALYIWERLEREMPEVLGSAAMITSREIYIGRERARKYDIEDVKRMLTRGWIRLIVSTDVASEGLNLQAANVVINYEPTWSPVKIEQRLGRVWRLGQERDVRSYTVFLGVESDWDVLEVLYGKLLNWGRSLSIERVPIGEEVEEIEFTARDRLSRLVPIEGGDSKTKYSEYTAIIKYLEGGKSGLNMYVESIIRALENLKRSLEKVGLSAINERMRIERFVRDVLGGLRGLDLEQIYRDLLLCVASLRGEDVRIEGGEIRLGPHRVESLDKYSRYIAEMLRDVGGEGKVIISSGGSGLEGLHLFRVEIYLGDRPIYSEVIGYSGGNDSEPIRGRRLLEIVIDALRPEHLLAVSEELVMGTKSPRGFINGLESRAIGWANMLVWEAVDSFTNYVNMVEKSGLSDKHEVWIPRPENKHDYYRVDAKYIGSIIFSQASGSGGDYPPPYKVKEVEEEAMRIALEYERRNGRVPEDVSMYEHFDILSRDPSSGEVRYIEVKGRSGMDMMVELTEAEFKVAVEKGDSYWLYIVQGVGTDSPRLITIRNPVKNMSWDEVSIKRYRFWSK